MSIKWLLLLYPQVWREQYEVEMVALLQQHNVTFLTIFDLVRGALEAHSDPVYSIPESTLISPQLKQLRAAYKTVQLTLLLFFIGFFSFISDRLEPSSNNQSSLNAIADLAYTVAGISGSTLLWVIFLSALLMAMPGIRSLNSSNNRQYSLRWFFPLAYQVFPLLGLGFVLRSGVPLLNVWPFFGVFLLPAIIAFTLTASQLNERMGRVALIPASLATAVMFIHVLTIIVFQTMTNFSNLDCNWFGPLGIGFALMVIPTFLAVRALLRGWMILIKELFYAR